jgi:formamidopyrimidine-DNA glycosylase
VDRSPASGRRGKLFLIELEAGEMMTLVVHLMSAGRLQLFDTRASLRDKTSRVLLRLDDGRELRLREFGTKQRAWAKLLRRGEVSEEATIAGLGPEAWPEPPVPEEFKCAARRTAAAVHAVAGPTRNRRHRSFLDR